MGWPGLFKDRPHRPEPQVFDHACLAAFLVAIGIIALLIISAAWLQAAGRDDPATDRAEASSSALDHCRTKGTAAGDDPTCRAAWAQARRAFFQGPEVSP
ncbi:putative entry exclusion protein TrbK-alt [Caulobacter sp. KR2-114]|uniref:putative entry exclusion protein TrbK-alt n=1 Tax=Caulobacter sp. KR2-114 TaxID=3400912 RepID=UPI003C0A3851